MRLSVTRLRSVDGPLPLICENCERANKGTLTFRALLRLSIRVSASVFLRLPTD